MNLFIWKTKMKIFLDEKKGPCLLIGKNNKNNHYFVKTSNKTLNRILMSVAWKDFDL